MSERQREIVELIDCGYMTYDALSEEMGMARSTLRDEVVRLCARYDCRMRDLPSQAGVSAAA